MKNEYDYLNNCKVDFSKYEQYEINDEELKKMKNLVGGKRKMGKLKYLVACAAIIALGSQTAFGEGFIKSLKTISLGSNTFEQFEVNENAVVNSYPNGYETETIEVSFNNGEYENPLNRYLEEPEVYTVMQEEEKLADFIKGISFEVKLPEKVIGDLDFLGAVKYGDSKDYIDIYYINADTGEYIFIQERAINDETAFGLGTDSELKEVKVNGEKAAMVGGRSLFWDKDGVSFSLSCHIDVAESKLIEMAESFK